MFFKRMHTTAKVCKMNPETLGGTSIYLNLSRYASYMQSTTPAYTGLPRKLGKSERKPWVTSITELKRRARRERKEKQIVREKVLRPPENGLLAKELIPVAKDVFAAQAQLYSCVSKVCKRIAVYVCRICGEVHVGHPPHHIRTCDVSGSLASKEHSWERGKAEHILPLAESFHLYDRIGRAVSHEEQLQVERLPAIVELCIQAGVDIPEYPTRRRTFPAYCVSGRVIDFEKRFPKEEDAGKDVNTCGFWQSFDKMGNAVSLAVVRSDDIRELAVQGMDAWDRLRAGASLLIQKYGVQTCGYCPEIQVGPKGHRVRNCQAYKHQMRDGQHAWQEATVEDLIPPVYVWHVGESKRDEPLSHKLRGFYGMLPAAVELFAQAGASVSREYWGTMRGDVVVPEAGEERLVV